MEPDDLAYLAGVLDTRAVVRTRWTTGTELPYVAVSSGDVQLMQWLARITGVRNIVTSRNYDKHRCLEHCTQAHEHIRSVSGRWSLTGARAVVVLAATQPWIRFQADAWQRALQVGLVAPRKPQTAQKMAALGWPLPAAWEAEAEAEDELERKRETREGEGEEMRDTGFDFENWRHGRVYYTADLHLGHERIIELCDRPFAGVREMNEAIISGINETVGTRDTLVVLGDVLLGRMEDSLPLLSQIRVGRIRIIPGNHDRFSLAYGHRGSPEVRINKRKLWLTQYQAHAGYGRRLRCEPDQEPSVWPGLVGGRPVLLSHYPYRGDSRGEGAGGAADRYEWLRPRWGGLPLIHGHVHNRWRVKGPMFNVGVDVNNFRPVSEWDLSDWLHELPLPVPLPVSAGVD